MCLKRPRNVAPRTSNCTIYIYLYKTRRIIRINTNNLENIIFAFLHLDLFIIAEVGGSNKNAKPKIITSGSSQLLTRVPVLDQLNRVRINCQFLANRDLSTARPNRSDLLHSFGWLLNACQAQSPQEPHFINIAQPRSAINPNPLVSNPRKIHRPSNQRKYVPHSRHLLLMRPC